MADFVSFIVAIHNRTYSRMQLWGTAHLQHGVWSPGSPYFGEPQEEIAPHSTESFRGESQGFLTGVEGTLDYLITQDHLPDEYIHIWFSNPAFGHPGFRASSSALNSFYRLEWGDPGGSDARINLDIWTTPAAAGEILHDAGCNVASLFQGSATPVSRDVTFDKMRGFRSSAFRDLPGLDRWWAEFNAAIPQLVRLAEENQDLRASIDRLLPRVDEFLSRPDEEIRHEDVADVRTVLAYLAAADANLSIRFAERGFRVLSALPGKAWSEALAIVSSAQPHAER
ncbi:hypothetical protein AB5J55_44415 [Streptomyces sp. R11]|uniref:Uncharacterized protein n=1 Tax=Streptomyces sp. R11 TaxID=3238625 RepID=A0AB39NC03_9ACTN